MKALLLAFAVSSVVYPHWALLMGASQLTWA